MNNLLKIEEVFFFLLSVYLFSLLEMSWWWFPLLLLIPDISMAGYIINSKVGAVIYNIFHHRAISVAIFILGALLNSQITQLIGIILFAHSSLDRIFDFGLKYMDNFNHTHLSKS